MNSFTSHKLSHSQIDITKEERIWQQSGTILLILNCKRAKSPFAFYPDSHPFALFNGAQHLKRKSLHKILCWVLQDLARLNFRSRECSVCKIFTRIRLCFWISLKLHLNLSIKTITFMTSFYLKVHGM